MPVANHRLDANQTLINAYDAILNRFRVDAEVHATFGDLEVSIHNEEDDILIYGQDSGGTNRAIRTDIDGLLQIDVISSALPTGAATEIKQDVGNTYLGSIDADIDVALSTRASEATLSTFNGKVNNNYGVATGAIRTASQIGNATGAADFNTGIVSPQTLRVTQATDIPITVINSGIFAVQAAQSGIWDINNITGTISLPTGAATSANQTTQITSLQILDDVPASINGPFNKGNPIMGQLDDTTTTIATEDNVAPIRITAQRAIHTNLRNNAGTEIATSGNPLRIDPTGTTTQPASLPDYSSTTGTTTIITRSTTVQTALAANANRKGFVFWNDSGANCFIKFASGATDTNYSVRIGNNTGYESQSTLRYTGIITVIWSTGSSGSLFVTEFT